MKNTTLNVNSPASLADEISESAKQLAQMTDLLQNALKRYQPELLDDFSTTIKTKRSKLKMTGEMVAELSGISLAAYQRIEQGKTSPRLETVLAICKTLGFNLCVI